jgi:nucleoside-triphosphatase
MTQKQTFTSALLLTGRPGIGKTTVIRNTIALLGGRAAGGFYTREIRRQGQRVGFELVTLDGIAATLATKLPPTFANAHPFGRYTVNLDAINQVGVPALRQAWQNERIVIIDEIGPMEIFSKLFREIVWQLLNSETRILATIIKRPHPFADEVKQFPGVRMIEVTAVNREALPDRLAAELQRA